MFYSFSNFNFQKIALQIKANLENVTELAPDGEDFRWYLKVQCHFVSIPLQYDNDNHF